MIFAKFKTKISVEAYLEGEKISQTKSEFINGEVYSMDDISEKHHRITLNLLKKIDSHLENSECDVFITVIKLKADASTFYYPDVFVACDKNPQSEYYREEPILIIEVTSPSTQQIDRREKLRVYQQIPSVHEYAVIEQDKIHIELHRRQPDGRWITYFFNDGDEDFAFESVNLSLKLSEVYNRVNFH